MLASRSRCTRVNPASSPHTRSTHLVVVSEWVSQTQEAEGGLTGAADDLVAAGDTIDAGPALGIGAALVVLANIQFIGCNSEREAMDIRYAAT